jgi:hypothetical protein
MNNLSANDLAILKNVDMSHLSAINSVFCSPTSVPLQVLIGCVKEFELFKWVTQSCTDIRLSKAYYDINLALVDLPVDGILLYLPLISIYLLFDCVDMYKKYIKDIFHSDICYNNRIVQIVMINNKHKFIISCTNDEKLISDLKKVLRSDCEIIKNEDMVQLTFNNIVVSSREDEIELFRKLKEKISHSSLSLLVVKDSLFSQKRYIEADVSNLLVMHTHDQKIMNSKMMKRLDDIWSYLKSQPPTVVNITVNNWI